MLDWRTRAGKKKRQQEVCHGKKASPSSSDAGGDARTASDHLSSVWKSDAHGPSQSSDGDDLTGSHAFDPQSVSLPQYGVSTLPPANTSRRRRGMGAAARGVRTGCDCPGRGAALSAAAQSPADSRGPVETRTEGGPTDGDRSALPL